MYAQVVRDSRRKWRQAHPDYQKNYWQTHPQAAQCNRQRQWQRDQKRRVQNLVKNNVLAEAERARRKIAKPAQGAAWGGYYGDFTDPDGDLWRVGCPGEQPYCAE